MRKAWHVVSALAFACLLLGAVGIGVGFFTGSSPTALEAHGHLAQYSERLALNWDILRQDAGNILAFLEQSLASLRAFVGL